METLTNQKYVKVMHAIIPKITSFVFILHEASPFYLLGISTDVLCEICVFVLMF